MKLTPLIAIVVLIAFCQSGGEPTPDNDDEPAPEPSQKTSEITWSDPVEVDTGDAFMGPWQMNESEFHYVDDPTVALGDDGVADVAWVDNRRQEVFFNRYDADNRAQNAEPVNVSRSPDIFSWLPRIARPAGDADTVYVLWQEIVFSGGSHGGEIFFSRSSDGGHSFSEPVNLSNTTAGAGKGRLTPQRWHNGSLDIALGADGEIYVAWTEYEGRLWFRRSDDGGKSFSDAQRIADGPADGGGAPPARGPSLAVGTDDTIYLAWAVGERPDADIHLTHSDDGGQSFADPRTVVTSDGHSDAPKLAATADGTLHLVYAESPAGLFAQSHVRYTRSGDGEEFAEPRRISPAPDGDEAAGFPAIAVDENDQLYVVWEHYPDFRHRPTGLGFAFSSDGKDAFSDPAIISGTAERPRAINGSLQGLLMQKIDAGSAGEVAVVHSFFDQGQKSGVQLIRGQLRE